MEGLGSLLDSLLARQVGMSIHEDPFKNSMDPYGILNTPQAQIYGPPVPIEQKQIDPSLLSGGFGEDVSMGGFEGRAPLEKFNIQDLINPNNTKLQFGLKPTDKYEQYVKRDRQGNIIEGDVVEMFNNMKFDPKDVYFNYRRDNENTGYGGPRTIQNFQLGPKRIGADVRYEFEPGRGISSLFK
jgi:hypothetical protein